MGVAILVKRPGETVVSWSPGSYWISTVELHNLYPWRLNRTRLDKTATIGDTGGHSVRHEDQPQNLYSPLDWPFIVLFP